MIVQTIIVSPASTNQNIIIGRRGTYSTEQILFDVSRMAQQFGPGTAVLMVKRSVDKAAYPAIIEQNGNTVIWTVSETDTSYKGHGECEIFWYVDGALAKSVIYDVTTLRDIGDTTETPPDPYRTWVDDLTELGAETLQNAQDAEAAAERAEAAAVHEPQIRQNGNWWVWDAATGAYVDTGIAARGPAGQDGRDGKDGQDGEDGQPGADGVSPTVEIETVTGSHSVTITDADHPQGQTFVVEDGEDGQTGPAGKSAYQQAVDGGYSGTEQEFDAELAGVANKQNKITASGILKGDGSSGVSAAVAGVDYALPTETVTVTGTTPTINAVAGKRYVCGEVATLTIAVPASGMIDVVFESGTTATVLTITPATGSTVKWANGFDPTALDTDTTYELNICDGLGVAAAWT